jgi:predicted transcriptional regulator
MTTLNIGDMIENAAVICHDAGISQTIEIMTAHQCDRVYVTDEAGLVSSVICDYRLLKALVRGQLASCSLSDLASPLSETLHPNQSLSQAAILFRSGYATEIPVFESHQFLGVVRRKDLLATLFNCEEIAGPTAGSVLTGLNNQQTRKIG